MTVKLKLTLLILIGILASVMVGIGGMVAQDKLVATILNLQTNDIPSIELLAATRADVLRVRSAVLEHLVSTTDEQTQLDQDIQRFDQNIQQHLNDYEKLLHGNEDKQLLEADRATFAAYVSARNTTLTESRTGHHDAANEARKAAKPKLVAVTKAIGDHIAYNDRFIAAEGKTASQMIANAKMLSWIMIAGALIAMGIVGFFLYRSVIGALTQMQRDIGELPPKFRLPKVT
mgnify:CR=1 FL=1